MRRVQQDVLLLTAGLAGAQGVPRAGGCWAVTVFWKQAQVLHVAKNFLEDLYMNPRCVTSGLCFCCSFSLGARAGAKMVNMQR